MEEKQLRHFMIKQKKLILNANEKEEIAELIGFATGFLNGMRISKAITKEQYEAEYGKLQTVAELKEAV